MLASPKKDASGKKTKLRWCLDPRAINAILRNDKFPIPLIREIFDQLNHSKVFSTLDLKNSYHQFPVRPQDRVKLSFTWRRRRYMYAGAPFGLKPLSGIFQRAMSSLFQDCPFVLTFIDDIIVHSPNINEHAEHLKLVIDRLTSANLMLRSDKCNFVRTQVPLLGHIVSSNGISVDPRKIVQIQEWPTPKTG